MNVLGVIPARYGSTRFPGKPLAVIHGKPMIQWVYERASEAGMLDEVLVATDDSKIVDAVERFGGRARLTSPHHRSGTERIAEIGREISADIYINIQGDEPLLDPEDIDSLAAELINNPDVGMATLKFPIRAADDITNPDVVKVVTDAEGYALYFSRSPIPYCVSEGARPEPRLHFKHIGIYAYRRETLFHLVRLERSPLELCERLEQLRALENGVKMKVAQARNDSISVDRPEDIQRVILRIEQE